MSEIRLKKIVDEKNIDLEKLSDKAMIPCSTIKEWYDNSKFDSKRVGVNELTNLAATLNVEITELIDFPKR